MKRLLSFGVALSIVMSMILSVSASGQTSVDAANVIGSDEFVLYISDEKSRSVYPVNVRTDILYLEDEGLGFRIYAETALPIVSSMSGFIEYNTSVEPDRGVVVNYSEDNYFPMCGIEWYDYTGRKFSSGVKITASFFGTVEADTTALYEDVVLDGYFSRTIEATIP